MNGASLRKIKPFFAPGERVGEDILAVAHVFPQSISKTIVGSVPRRIEFEQLHQLLGLLNGKKPQHDGINQAENGCVGADSQCERQHCHEGEAGRLT